MWSQLLSLLFPPRHGSRSWEEITKGDLASLAHVHAVSRCPHTYALLPYAKPEVRELLWALKYRGATSVGTTLGGLLAQFLPTLSLPPETVFVAMPLSKERLRQRGFNQCEVIASGAGLFCSPVLVRTRNTEHQARLSHARRAKNIAGSFSIADHADIAGKSVVLIDDVVTTGATMQEARATLLNAGAKEVICIALAH